MNDNYLHSDITGLIIKAFYNVYNKIIEIKAAEALCEEHEESLSPFHREPGDRNLAAVTAPSAKGRTITLPQAV